MKHTPLTELVIQEVDGTTVCCDFVRWTESPHRLFPVAEIQKYSPLWCASNKEAPNPTLEEVFAEYPEYKALPRRRFGSE